MDRFRLDDPDAAEPKAARRDRVWGELIACYGEGEDTDWQYLTDLTDLVVKMIEDELDAIEQPRLPTRSEVESKVRAWPGDVGAFATAIARFMKNEGWATENPEPEVDPAQVEALGLALAAAGRDGASWLETAKRLLASGRVQVTP